MGSVGVNTNNALNVIKQAYPKSVIGEFKNGVVTFRYSANGKEYTYKVNNADELASKLNINTSTSKDAFKNSFFGDTKAVSNNYFTMSKQVSNDGNTIAFTTRNVVVVNGGVVLITGDKQGIYLKDSQYNGVSVKNGNQNVDALMIKMNRDDYNNAKRYTFKNGFGDIQVDKTQSFDDLKKVATSQQKAKNKYKKYNIAVYRDRIESSVGKKGKRLV